MGGAKIIWLVYNLPIDLKAFCNFCIPLFPVWPFLSNWSGPLSWLALLTFILLSTSRTAAITVPVFQQCIFARQWAGGELEPLAVPSLVMPNCGSDRFIFHIFCHSILIHKMV